MSTFEDRYDARAAIARSDVERAVAEDAVDRHDGDGDIDAWTRQLRCLRFPGTNGESTNADHREGQPGP